MPHPYLAFALHPDENCAAEWVNRYGMVGRDFPVERQNNSYNVLLLGGSVAMFLGQYFEKMPLYLEDALNKCYVPPKGKSFNVYNGAIGGYRYPQQAVVFLLFARAFDAAVTLEGWNEYDAALRADNSYGGPTGRFETPDVYYTELISKRGDNKVVASVYLAKSILGAAKQRWLTQHSFFTYFFIEQAVSWLKAQAREAIDEKNNTGRTTAESTMRLPDDWDHDRVARFNIEQYKWYIINMHAMAAAEGIKFATFLQPAPSHDKQLTPEEIEVVGKPLDREPVSYPTMVDEMTALSNSRGLAVFSLLDVFKDRKETIYADPVHYEIEGIYPDSKFHNSGVPMTGRSLGYELVAAAMAKRMAKTFNFERRANCQSR